MLEFINCFNYQFYNEESFRNFIKHFDDSQVVKKRQGKYYHRYLNIPCSFDIEVSSFRNKIEEKCSIMYVWQVCINGYVWLGRTYKELNNMFNCLHDELRLGYLRKVVFYIHNAQYEFNNLRKYLDIIDYFGLDNRKPLYFVDKRGIEFRCSYQLSGYSLEYLGNEILTKYKVAKMVGDLDYSLIRSPETPLKRKEIGYIVNDVRIVVNYIKELMEHGEDLSNIPYTKTGRVRRALIQSCLRNDKGKINQKYLGLMQTLTINSIDEYNELKEAFSGGFTHSNPFNTNMTFLRSEGRGVLPADICSEYPWIMCVKKFPMSSGHYHSYMTMNEYKQRIKAGQHIIARFIFNNLESTFLSDHYISSSKCRDSKDIMEANGRVVSGSFEITLTELDFDIIEKTYEWENVYIYDAYVYFSAYLPIQYVNTILDFYKAKTSLKGIEEAYQEYMNKKEMLNASYGGMVTDPVKDTFAYENDNFQEVPIDVEEALENYNKKKNRTNFYAWGIYVTAWARHELWINAILPLEDKYIYADTDSCYAIDDGTIINHFQNINRKVYNEICYVSRIRNIPLERFMPETVKRIKKPLGFYEMDHVEDFKTLGAKRYLVRFTNKEGKEEYKITVSGINKKAAKYVESQGGFKFFKDGMKIPAEHAGRNIVAYIDDRRRGELTDYLGCKYTYDIRCGVHMEASEYQLSMYSLFVEYLKEIISYEANCKN